MKIFGLNIERRSNPAENPRVPLSSPKVMQMLGIANSTGDVFVSEETAMRVSAVYTCVKVIAETIASLPVGVYKRTEDGGKEAAEDHPYSELVRELPNPSMTSFQWREVMLAHALLWGNAYALLEMNGAGKIIGIYPLMPHTVTPRRVPSTRAIVYDVSIAGGGTETLPAREILHISALGWDGIKGVSPIGQMRKAIGLAITAEDFGARFFANDARPGLIVEHPGQLSDKAKTNIRDSIETNVGGQNRGRPLVLEEAMKLHEVGIPPEDAQFLETRKFQKQEIYSIYRVPPHMAGDLDRATFSNIEHQDIGFAKHCIRPWLVRIEQAMNVKLFPKRDCFVEYNIDGLMRGDFKSRMEGYQIAVGGPFLTPNEARQLENWEKRPGLDEILKPMNMAGNDKPKKDGGDDAPKT